jgi:hypothetical protein
MMPLICPNANAGPWSSDPIPKRTCPLVQQTCGVNPAIASQSGCRYCSGANPPVEHDTSAKLVAQMLRVAITSPGVTGALSQDAALAALIIQTGAAAATAFLQSLVANCALNAADAEALAAAHGLALTLGS